MDVLILWNLSMQFIILTNERGKAYVMAMDDEKSVDETKQLRLIKF